MTSVIVTALLWAAVLGSGVMAGIYFAFSTFIMRAFGHLEPAQAVAAMNAINAGILRSLFMPLFFGSSLVSLLLAIAGMIRWEEPGAGWMLLAGVVYLLGMFVCTVLFNVPLNQTLAAVEPNLAAAAQHWSHYLQAWTRWNHLRTLASLVTCTIGVWLLANPCHP